MDRSSHHVVHNPNGGWDVKRGGAQRSSGHYSTKQEAGNAGRQISRNQGTEFVIHGMNGRIQSSDSHGRESLSAKRISWGGEKYGCNIHGGKVGKAGKLWHPKVLPRPQKAKQERLWQTTKADPREKEPVQLHRGPDLHIKEVSLYNLSESPLKKVSNRFSCKFLADYCIPRC